MAKPVVIEDFGPDLFQISPFFNSDDTPAPGQVLYFILLGKAIDPGTAVQKHGSVAT